MKSDEIMLKPEEKIKRGTVYFKCSNVMTICRDCAIFYMFTCHNTFGNK